MTSGTNTGAFQAGPVQLPAPPRRRHCPARAVGAAAAAPLLPSARSACKAGEGGGGSGRLVGCRPL